MKRAEAPQAGWYPDPVGGHRLRWWDGLDWTDHHRTRGPGQPRGDGSSDPKTPAGAAVDAARSAGSVASSSARSAGSPGSDEAAAVVAEARRAARDEVERAVRDAQGQLEQARGRYEPMVREYLAKGRRWLRTVGIAAAVLFVLWLVLSAVTQVSLLDWLGDRIDAVTTAARGVPDEIAPEQAARLGPVR